MGTSVRSLKLGSLAGISLFASGALAQADAPGVAGPVPLVPPVPITVLASSPRTAQGLVFLTPTSAAAGATQGEEIVDDQGRPVWFAPVPAGETAFDFRVQTLHGEPVLTWIQSKGVFSTGPTTDYIADAHYHVIATVTAGNGLTADIH